MGQLMDEAGVVELKLRCMERLSFSGRSVAIMISRLPQHPRKRKSQEPAYLEALSQSKKIGHMNIQC